VDLAFLRLIEESIQDVAVSCASGYAKAYSYCSSYLLSLSGDWVSSIINYPIGECFSLDRMAAESDLEGCFLMVVSVADYL